MKRFSQFQSAAVVRTDDYKCLGPRVPVDALAITFPKVDNGAESASSEDPSRFTTWLPRRRRVSKSAPSSARQNKDCSVHQPAAAAAAAAFAFPALTVSGCSCYGPTPSSYKHTCADKEVAVRATRETVAATSEI
eukprot:1792254-Amphidinium_carterae.1